VIGRHRSTSASSPDALPSTSVGRPSPPDVAPSLPSFSGSAEETIVGDFGALASPDSSLGRGDQVGRYLLLDPLGRGAMGQVFRAYDPDLDRQVAIKILDERGGPGARERLLQEAKAMARIHHPHVVTVYDAGMHEGSVFIAMEIVDGPSLDRWLAGPRSSVEVLDVLADAARGLAAAHSAGVIHRDFKPANVLVGAGGRAKVGDFGLAGIEDPATGPITDTTPSPAIGTPAYMSPEHFAGVGIDARSDQFSFAIMVHEALYGVRPFSARTWPELVVQVTTGAVIPSFAARRGRVDGILRRALSVDPAQRFESMDALVAALERARRPAWRRWIAVGAVTVTLGSVILAAGAEPDEVCAPGARRVDAVWNDAAVAALRIGGSDYTEAFVRQVRGRFVSALDDYAAAWAIAHDETCAAVGPRADAGTPAQRHTAECLENRLDSLQGLAELATTEPLAADRVADLVRALPAIEACTSGSWVPYPSDPEEAAQAAALHRKLAKIKLLHLQGHQALALEQARAALEEARALGDRYLLALALLRHAVVLEQDPRAFARFDEAIELALAGGFDRLAVEAIHQVLLWSWPRDEGHSWREVGHLAAVARGLVERTTADPSTLGNLALSEGYVLRRANRLDEAEACDRRAEALFVRADDREGMAKARINRAVTAIRQGRLDEALPRLEAAVKDLEHTVDASSDLYFQAQHVLVGALTSAGRQRDAYVVAAAAYASASELYAPDASTFRRVMFAYATTAGNVGELAVAREVLARRREITRLTRTEAEALDVLELELLLAEGRFDRVTARVEELRRSREPDDEIAHAWLDLYAVMGLFLQGRRAEVHERLLDPPIVTSTSRDHEGIHATMVLLAMLSQAPPPPGGWRSLFPPTPYQRTLTERVRLLVDALDSGRDTVATARRFRAEMAAAYHPGEPTVRLLDAWLADRERDTPPAARAPR
jgi:eukaryotic-like serine/threonine-protein kinase